VKILDSPLASLMMNAGLELNQNSLLWEKALPKEHLSLSGYAEMRCEHFLRPFLLIHLPLATADFKCRRNNGSERIVDGVAHARHCGCYQYME